MPCFHPLKGFRGNRVNPNTGKRNITVVPRLAFVDLPITIACGQCVGCRLERSRQWAIRCVHEASLYDDNCFITLTYNNEHLPKHQSLVKSDFQKFMKRLRFKYGSGIRYYMCGEYGENFGRPHYHALLFNFRFRDQTFFRNSPAGEKLYVSQSLEKLWSHPNTGTPMGYASIGSATFESAAYVARYIMKKQLGKNALYHYNQFDEWTGEILSERVPEYNTMSRRPGIAKNWFDKYLTDVYPGDFVVMNDKKIKPPKYYDKQYELLYPEELEKLKRQRIAAGKLNAANNTPERLAVREEIQEYKLKSLTRRLPNVD